MFRIITKPIQIKKEDVAREIRALAALTGQPITDAVGGAVRERLERVRRLGDVEARRGGPLNLGDCFAYALAEAQGDRLLFKGGHFPKTDVKPAI